MAQLQLVETLLRKGCGGGVILLMKLKSKGKEPEKCKCLWHFQGEKSLTCFLSQHEDNTGKWLPTSLALFLPKHPFLFHKHLSYARYCSKLFANSTLRSHQELQHRFQQHPPQNLQSSRCLSNWKSFLRISNTTIHQLFLQSIKSNISGRFNITSGADIFFHTSFSPLLQANKYLHTPLYQISLLTAQCFYIC